jgi:hypothetical protein
VFVYVYVCVYRQVEANQGADRVEDRHETEVRQRVDRGLTEYRQAEGRQRADELQT